MVLQEQMESHGTDRLFNNRYELIAPLLFFEQAGTVQVVSDTFLCRLPVFLEFV